MADFLRPDDALRALRPVVVADSAPPVGPNLTPADFLHYTLRPLLKLQNPVLLAVVADFVRDHQISLATAAPPDQQLRLAELLGRNTKLRYTVIGLVVGLFTTTELAFYQQHRPELNRRLLELATRRVQDQTAAIVESSR